MKTKYISSLVLAIACFLVFSVLVSAQEDGGKEQEDALFIDRIAVRTNAVDWLLTIPNIGVEFDLTGSEFNSMTLGLSAKYNWNTSHSYDLSHNYAPPTVFNLFDVRPEFRYYYRAVDKGTFGSRKWSVDKLLKEQKHPKPWRAYYVGAYVNYGTYALKFGEKGSQGNVAGFGATAGYAIPMYEYKKGAVDVELGFSVGLQFASRNMFTHNPDGFFYTHVDGGKEKMGFTPFPVVSDLRVAFVWRHTSIKDKVKTDEERMIIKEHYNTILVDYTYDACTKAAYDEVVKSDRRYKEIMANDSLYNAGFVAMLNTQKAQLEANLMSAFPDGFRTSAHSIEIVEAYEAKLAARIESGWKKAMAAFRSERRKELNAIRKAEADARKAEKKKAAEEDDKIKETKKKETKKKSEEE